MIKDKAIETAQSALKLKHRVTHNNAGIWCWMGYGWKVYMNDSGVVLAVIDEWSNEK